MQGRNFSLPTDDYDAVEQAAKKERARQHEQRKEEMEANLRAGFRLPGDGGFDKKLWGKGKSLKGVTGSR